MTNRTQKSKNCDTNEKRKCTRKFVGKQFIYNFINFINLMHLLQCCTANPNYFIHLQIGIQRFQELAESTCQLSSIIACKKLRDVIEHKRRNKRDGTPIIQEHCTSN